jgi:hypothetical protein
MAAAARLCSLAAECRDMPSLAAAGAPFASRAVHVPFGRIRWRLFALELIRGRLALAHYHS